MRYVLHLFVIIVLLCGLSGRVAAAEQSVIDAMMADRILGDAAAPVTLLDFSSLTCPHCALFHKDILPKLKEKYIDTGKVRLIFQDFPLDRNSLHASMLARCADPKRFYGFLDVLFKSLNNWSHAPDPLKALAQIGALGGVPPADFAACMANKELEDAILQRTVEAQKKYKVQSTPTFILNGGAERVDGALPLDKFEAAIDRLLTR